MCDRTCVYVLATDGVVTFVSAAAGARGFAEQTKQIYVKLLCIVYSQRQCILLICL